VRFTDGSSVDGEVPVRVVEADQAEPAIRPVRGRRRAAGSVLPLLLGLLAVVCSAALPFAPVEMSTPAVSWPQQPTAPVSTMLELTDQQPAALDVTVSCAAVRAAAGTGGVVLSTLLPANPAAAADGLLLTARDGEFVVRNRGADLVREPVRDGACAYRLLGSPAELTVSRDGEVLAVDRAGGRAAARAEQARAGTRPPSVADVDTGADGDVLPDVDVLATDLVRLPGDGDLRVELTVDDAFDTRPGAGKTALVVVALLAAAGSLVALRCADRREPARPDAAGEGRAGRGPRALTGLVDAAVVGTMLLWLFLAPQSDDDGYYAAMARNSADAGFVGNYYQLLNQSFTPFTWFYRALGWWQEVGDSPVVLRLPVLAVGLATWVVARRLVSRPGALPAGAAGSRWARPAVVLVLAACFLAWWLPYGMGVRPEAVVGLLAAVTLLAVLAALRSRRLLPAGIAVGCAAMALACHPIGLVAFAPLLAGLPRLVRLVGAGRTRAQQVSRTALLLAPGAFAAAAAFADGSLHDFVRGQEIFLSITPQNAWWDEYQRYTALLEPGPMGSYAKRAAVLLALVCLVWFLALAVAARARTVRLPLPLVLSGQSLALAFLLLWTSPSKWTHHFGALAGLGPVFLALLLAAAPGLVPRVAGARGLAPATRVLLLGSGVVTFALALRGPNLWAYSWLPGLPNPGEPPIVGPVRLGTLTVWAGITVAALAVGRLLRRRRGRAGIPVERVAVPLVVVFLLTSVGYLVGGFGLAALGTRDGYSPWGDALTDPLASGCGAAGAIDVLDPAAADPLAPAEGIPVPTPEPPFVEGTGWDPAGPPPAPAGQGVARYVWGSLAGPGGADATGTLVTPWFELPPAAEGEALALLAAGRLAGGDVLRVEYGIGGSPDGPGVVATETLGDGQDSATWRTLVLDPAPARAAGAGVLRLVVEDRTGGPGGWLAVTGPATMPWRPLPAVLDADAPVATAWQIAFLFPCQRQPAVRHGITEPVVAGVVWTDVPGTTGLADATWQVHRGGLFAPVQRTSGVTRLATRLEGAPGVGNIEVYAFAVPYASDAYDLRLDRVQRWGWAGPPG
jgi:hypothetical protein